MSGWILPRLSCKSAQVRQKDLPAQRFWLQNGQNLAGQTWSGRASEQRWARIETGRLGCVQLGLR